MNGDTRRNHDQLEDNIEKLVKRARPNLVMPPDAKARILSELAGGQGAAGVDRAQETLQGRILKMMRKPSVLSASGLAASVALAAALLLSWNGTPEVRAATVLQKLNAQIEQNSLFEVKLASISVDGTVVDGTLRVWRRSVVGEVTVQTRTVKAEGSLALSEDGGWILIRKLTVRDRDAQLAAAKLVPPGYQTLLVLPDDTAYFGLGSNVITEVLNVLRSGQSVRVLRELVNAYPDYGATLEQQADRTLLLVLPFDDKEAVAGLERLVGSSQPVAETLTRVRATIGRTAKVERCSASGIEVEEFPLDSDAAAERLQQALRCFPHGNRVDIDTSGPSVVIEVVPLGSAGLDYSGLLGSTMTVIYDPTAERVQSFAIRDYGRTKGSITVEIGEGEIDAAQVDSGRVTTPNTVVVDLKALEALMKTLDEASK